MDIRFDVLCAIEKKLLEDVSSLLQSLISMYCKTGAKYIQSVLLIPEDGIETATNAILRNAYGNEVDYRTGPHKPLAVAVPITCDSNLECYIVVDQQLFDVSESVEHTIVSAILEEVLHVEQYALTWETYRWIRPIGTSIVENDFLELAVFLIDEYWVARKKASIMASMYDVVDPNGVALPLYIWYGGDLLDLLGKASSQLAVPQANILGICGRYIFEPLTRDAGFHAQNPPDAIPEVLEGVEASEFYQLNVKTYWSRIEEQLIGFFDSAISKERSTRNIARHIQQFIDHMESIH